MARPSRELNGTRAPAGRQHAVHRLSEAPESLREKASLQHAHSRSNAHLAKGTCERFQQLRHVTAFCCSIRAHFLVEEHNFRNSS